MDRLGIEQWWKEHKLNTVWALFEVETDDSIHFQGVFDSKIAAMHGQSVFLESEYRKDFLVEEIPVMTLSTIQKFK